MSEPVPLQPRADPPPREGYVSKIKMSVGVQRFELTVRVEAREIPPVPAEIIEIPKRPEK